MPMLALLLLDAIVTYVVALTYSNRVHDKDLADEVLTVAQMVQRYGVNNELPPQARFLIEYDPDGHNHFSIVSRRRGLLSGHGRFFDVVPSAGAKPALYDMQTDHHSLRVAAYSMQAPDDPQDIITVSIGETLQDRHLVARDILFLTIPLQSLLIICALLLVWRGVSHGLDALRPLIGRLAGREHELEPITATDVPVEILPLTRTIDLLFARLKKNLQSQERFLADAAHQLRTPLAGLRLHVEHALGDTSIAERSGALRHIRQLTERTTRIATQLLAMTRAQSSLLMPEELALLDLSRLVPEIVALRAPEALHAGLNLGYQGHAGPVMVRGHAGALQELLDNLIDNAMRYAGDGHNATVVVAVGEDGTAELAVEDDGPGVSAEWLERLGERFFRVPGNEVTGSGLGLAIVRQIAELHGAWLSFESIVNGGLRVSIRFPAVTTVIDIPKATKGR
jgi:two-component system sensor histidine kinase TctE